jgi:uncharacterized RDD family membrane protein YckC
VLAHWWKRVVAAIIDAFVVGIPGSIVVALIGVGAFAASDVEVDPVTGEVTSGEGGFIATFVLTPLLIWIFILAYQTYFNGNERGQTVGKMVMKLQVRDEATGGPIGYGKAALRGFVGLILGILCYIPGIIDILFPLWDAKRQTLHDKAANSLVIDLNP